MINYRQGIFETNSSSTHSLYFANEEEFSDFTADKTVIDENGNFVKWEDAVRWIIEDSKRNGYNNLKDGDGESLSFEDFRALEKDEQSYWLHEYGYKTFNDIGTYLEYYHSSHTTEHGDVVHVFGEYGNDY